MTGEKGQNRHRAAGNILKITGSPDVEDREADPTFL